MEEKVIKEYPLINRVYKHYKGAEYNVIYIAKHTETGEDMVVYKSIQCGSIFVRPLSMWFDIINVSNPKESFKGVKRFELT